MLNAKSKQKKSSEIRVYKVYDMLGGMEFNERAKQLKSGNSDR
jgi:hypothetical protein